MTVKLLGKRRVLQASYNCEDVTGCRQFHAMAFEPHLGVTLRTAVLTEAILTYLLNLVIIYSMRKPSQPHIRYCLACTVSVQVSLPAQFRFKKNKPSFLLSKVLHSGCFFATRSHGNCLTQHQSSRSFCFFQHHMITNCYWRRRQPSFLHMHSCTYGKNHMLMAAVVPASLN